MGIHHEQISASLRHAVQEVLQQGLQDPRVRGLISVTRLELSGDGEQATVYVSVLPAEHAELTMHGIRHATRHIRSKVAKRVSSMRRLPKLHFRLDSSLKNQAGVLEALNSIETDGDDTPSSDADSAVNPEETNS